MFGYKLSNDKKIVVRVEKVEFDSFVLKSKILKIIVLNLKKVSLFEACP